MLQVVLAVSLPANWLVRCAVLSDAAAVAAPVQTAGVTSTWTVSSGVQRAATPEVVVVFSRTAVESLHLDAGTVVHVFPPFQLLQQRAVAGVLPVLVCAGMALAP